MEIIQSVKKPDWLKKKINLGQCQELYKLFGELNLNTVCKEAHCPNIGECFSAKVAAFLILGNICTRYCSFCAIKQSIPGIIDFDEHRRIAAAVKKLGLRHVVITSVTRDDLADGGAGEFVKTIKRLKALDNNIRVEVLVPDFQGCVESVRKVINAGCDIFAHNIETVPALYKKVRQGSGYKRSLQVLETAKVIKADVYTKSGLMLGLGETKAQVLEVLQDIKKTGCNFLSIGQYLAPSKEHHPVMKFVHPDEFDYYKQKALELGFSHIESGPYVRSSYIASNYL